MADYMYVAELEEEDRVQRVRRVFRARFRPLDALSDEELAKNIDLPGGEY